MIIPTHVVSGATPGFHRYEVIDLDTGTLLRHVIEVDTTNGLVRLHHIGTEEIVELRGRFEIRERTLRPWL